ncbi:MAG: hypothetical protein GTN36_02740 [Candidatus Aenigmarchaeota archaeon]|nr:hypothetical protein [Candidatus Aenigmarchaeota archaeon]
MKNKKDIKMTNLEELLLERDRLLADNPDLQILQSQLDLLFKTIGDKPLDKLLALKDMMSQNNDDLKELIKELLDESK